MKGIFAAIATLLLLLACESRVNYEKPKDLIPREQMIDMLFDMHLAVGTSNVKNKHLEKNRNYMSLVYEKYDIDSTRFKISNIYYTSRVVEYEEMLEEVQERINVLYEANQTTRDSLINAAKRRGPKPKDSLRAVPAETIKN